MILMDIRLDNFYTFSDFHMNMSYPKKIVNSYIENECLEGFTNFRYKKVNILMGANATGKTTFGKIMQQILTFIETKQYMPLYSVIGNPEKTASFLIEIVAEDNCLYRIHTLLHPIGEGQERVCDQNVYLSVTKVPIGINDSYEKCKLKLDLYGDDLKSFDSDPLKKIPHLRWCFAYSEDNENSCESAYNNDFYLTVLEKTLKILDPGIQKVERSKEVKNALIIRMNQQDIILQNGGISNSKLSSGTKAGFDIAEMIAAIFTNKYHFFYCDEKFSYVHAEIEKTLLTIMIDNLPTNSQLFFTTHNTDILDLPLPKHAFTFLKKQIFNDVVKSSCVYASNFLKRNTDSLRNAYENDLFSTLPDVDKIYELANRDYDCRGDL